MIGTLSTFYGRRLAGAPIPLAIPRAPAAAAAFAIRADHAADSALAEGRFEVAERLSHAAHEARCRVNGGSW